MPTENESLRLATLPHKNLSALNTTAVRMELQIGTWNVQTMLQAGKIKEMTEKLIKWDVHIKAIQEIRWNGSGWLVKKDYILLYGGERLQNGNQQE
jgi:hypothetical protein